MTDHDFIGARVEDLPSPVVLIDLPTVQRNIAAMAAHADKLDVALRPHWKTTKSAQVAGLQLEAGASGHTVATAQEAVALADAGFTDIFWAYPTVGPYRVAAALDLAQRTRLIVGPDSVAAARPLATAATERGIEVEVRLEVDTGVNRTGVEPEAALEVAKELSRMTGIHLEGIFTHEGHVQGVGTDHALRERTGIAAGALLAEVAEEIRTGGIGLDSVSVGSTAGVQSAPTVAGITEARPGTYIYGDENQVFIGTIASDETAMTVLSRVISVERSGPVLIDAGIKAMSSDASMHGDGRIGTVPSGPGVVVAGHEEHGFLRGSVGLRVGDLVSIRPNHACGVTNMHSQVFAVENGLVVDRWATLGRH
ncbi:alanine racemase [Garicola koreensis]|uniref:D-serine deaminase-like pyridoxal phosphate-dependent protein n=1 Tax=Garicola koreensis TaxID=1262554 RepID=A0A7W5XND6_9MICC|nr:alanine racemase [Garicola koreensis]MBB3666502.1 D-serine deaminase-like pyridoxal phosphate-dependent protein [Garicola koreensis]